jgi:hypothetical protein
MSTRRWIREQVEALFDGPPVSLITATDDEWPMPDWTAVYATTEHPE